jgi:hypothetical protein
MSCEICNNSPCSCDELASRSPQKPLFTLDCIEVVCEHNRREYQPSESDTNVSESSWCLDCGDELPLQETDPELELSGLGESL